MRKSILFLSLLIWTSSVNYAHPVHVSILNISIEDKILKVNLSTFVDDWETAYFHFYGKKTDLKSENIATNTWFVNYLKKSLQISSKKESIPFEIAIKTVSFDDLAMKIEFDVELTKELNSLYIYNAILTDIFADQTNLVIVSDSKHEKGIKFDYKRHEELLKLW